MKIWKVAVLPALFVSVPLAAQDIAPALDPGTMIGYAGVVAAGEYAQRDLGSRLTKARAQPRAPVASPAAIVARTSYRADPAVRRKVYTRAVATIQKASPQDAAQLRTQLANGQLRAGVAAFLQRYGMSANNVVDTTPLYLATAWFAAWADSGNPSLAQVRGLRAQVAQAYATMPGLLRASDAAKQELAEATIIEAWLASTMANQAAQDRKIAGAVRAAVTRAVRDMYQLDILSIFSA